MSTEDKSLKGDKNQLEGNKRHRAELLPENQTFSCFPYNRDRAVIQLSILTYNLDPILNIETAI